MLRFIITTMVVFFGIFNLQKVVHAQTNRVTTDDIESLSSTTGEETPSYSEFFLGDNETPLFLLGRESLSPSDRRKCFITQDIDDMIENIIENRAELDDVISEVPKPQQISTDAAQLPLLGFPLTALNKPLMLGGSVTGFSYPDLLSERTYHKMFSQYRLRYLSVELQAKLTKPENTGECFLDFIQCGRDGHCFVNDRGQVLVYIKVPVLGISQRYQAVIIDLDLLADQLRDEIIQLQQYPLSSLLPSLFNIQASQLSVVDFSQSTFIFDINKTLEFYTYNQNSFENQNPFEGAPQPPQVTSRWFIKFGLEENKSDFVAMPPTEGVEYLTTNSPLYSDVFIYHQNISPESPTHVYVKNFPDEHKEVVRQSFQYWNSIHLSLVGYPAFSYQFIEGDHDGQKEIITGDIRYNVLEWNEDRFPRQEGLTFHQVDQKTGEILSTNTLIRGFHTVDEYSKWFRYSEMIRANETVVDEDFSSNFNPQNNPFGIISQVSIEGFSPHLQVNLLAPEGEDVESYIFNVLKYAVTHEIGHRLGFEHNSEASSRVKDNISYSVMDTLGLGDDYNFRYDATSGNYDEMTMGYSYLGRLPERIDTSCRWDEIVNLRDGPTEEQKSKSPECLAGDATNFPIGNYTNKLKGVLDLLITRKDDQSFPYLIWDQSIGSYVYRWVSSIAFYYFTADTHYDQLRTVLIDGHKPQNPQEVKDLVMEHLNPILCEPRLSDIIYNNRTPFNVFDRYLRSNAIQFARGFVRSVFLWTDIDTISCPNSQLVFRRQNEEPSR